MRNVSWEVILGFEAFLLVVAGGTLGWWVAEHCGAECKQTDRQADRETERQTDRDRQTGRQAGRQAGSDICVMLNFQYVDLFPGMHWRRQAKFGPTLPVIQNNRVQGTGLELWLALILSHQPDITADWSTCTWIVTIIELAASYGTLWLYGLYVFDSPEFVIEVR